MKHSRITYTCINTILHIYPLAVDPMEDMLNLIRQGVKLKPIAKQTNPVHAGASVGDHASILREALDRISIQIRDSDDEGSFEDQDFED